MRVGGPPNLYKELDPLLTELGFPDAQAVRGRSSVADLFRPGSRYGLYVLHFADGEHYAGQAVDVTRRYAQHRKTHADIEAVRFREMAQQNLNREERHLIETLEAAGLRLRNVTFASVPREESDFDLVMPREEQEAWLNGVEPAKLTGGRLEDPALRARYARHLERFLRHPLAPAAIAALSRFVRSVIPLPERGEVSFWACSCLPSSPRPGLVVLSRINVNMQEVFTVAAVDGTPEFSVHLARSPLESVYGSRLDRLERRHPDVWAADHRYAPGDQDQVNLVTDSQTAILRLLADPAVVRATRLLNLRLMLKGPTKYNRYHCLGLADYLLK